MLGLERRAPAVRIICWAGLLLPASFVVPRAADAVLADPFTPLSLFRGVAPVICLAAALMISRSPVRPLGRHEWLLAGYLAVVVVSVTWSLAPQATLLKAGHLVVAWALLVLLSRHWRDRREALHELSAIVYAVVVLAAIGGLVAPEAAFAGWERRLASLLPALHPVVLGLVASVAILMLATGTGPRLVVERWVPRTMLLVLAVGVLGLSRTRSAVILLVVGGALYLFLRGRRAAAASAIVALALATVGLLASPWAEEVRQLFFRRGSFETILSLHGRLPMWRDAFEVVKERPITGFGYYAGHRVGPYAERFAERFGSSEHAYIDGTWSETMLELGVLGVVALAAFVGYCVWDATRLRLRGERLASLHLSLLAMLTVYSITDFTVQQVGFPMAVFGTLLLASRLPRSSGGETPASGNGS